MRMRLAGVVVTISCILFGASESAGISNEKLCQDIYCKEAISKAEAVQDYFPDSQDKLFLRFPKGAKITVLSKSAGSRPDLWSGTYENSLGYFSKSYVKETEVFYSDPTVFVPIDVKDRGGGHSYDDTGTISAAPSHSGVEVVDAGIGADTVEGVSKAADQKEDVLPVPQAADAEQPSATSSADSMGDPQLESAASVSSGSTDGSRPAEESLDVINDPLFTLHPTPVESSDSTHSQETGRSVVDQALDDAHAHPTVDTTLLDGSVKATDAGIGGQTKQVERDENSTQGSSQGDSSGDDDKQESASRDQLLHKGSSVKEEKYVGGAEGEDEEMEESHVNSGTPSRLNTTTSETAVRQDQVTDEVIPPQEVLANETATPEERAASETIPPREQATNETATTQEEVTSESTSGREQSTNETAAITGHDDEAAAASTLRFRAAGSERSATSDIKDADAIFTRAAHTTKDSHQSATTPDAVTEADDDTHLHGTSVDKPRHDTDALLAGREGLDVSEKAADATVEQLLPLHSSSETSGARNSSGSSALDLEGKSVGDPWASKQGLLLATDKESTQPKAVESASHPAQSAVEDLGHAVTSTDSASRPTRLEDGAIDSDLHEENSSSHAASRQDSASIGQQGDVNSVASSAGGREDSVSSPESAKHPEPFIGITTENGKSVDDTEFSAPVTQDDELSGKPVALVGDATSFDREADVDLRRRDAVGAPEEQVNSPADVDGSARLAISPQHPLAAETAEIHASATMATESTREIVGTDHGENDPNDTWWEDSSLAKIVDYGSILADFEQHPPSTLSGRVELQMWRIAAGLPAFVQQVMQSRPLGIQPPVFVLANLVTIWLLICSCLFVCCTGCCDNRIKAKAAEARCLRLYEQLNVAEVEARELRATLQQSEQGAKTEARELQRTGEERASMLEDQVRALHAKVESEEARWRSLVGESEAKLQQTCEDLETARSYMAQWEAYSQDLKGKLEVALAAAPDFEDRCTKAELIADSYKEKCVVLETSIVSLEEEMALLRQERDHLKVEAADRDDKDKEFESRLREQDAERTELQAVLAAREMEVVALRDAYEGLLLAAGNEPVSLSLVDSTDVSAEDSDVQGDDEGVAKKRKVELLAEKHLKQVVEAAKVRAQLQALEEESRVCKEQLELTRTALFEHQGMTQLHLSEKEKLLSEVSSLKRSKDEAETSLKVLTSYFKEKEAELHKSLGEKESTSKATGASAAQLQHKCTELQFERDQLRKEVKDVRDELQTAEKDMRKQLLEAEKKAHDAWISLRSKERELSAQLTESSQLRQKLLDAELGRTKQDEGLRELRLQLELEKAKCEQAMAAATAAAAASTSGEELSTSVAGGGGGEQIPQATKVTPLQQQRERPTSRGSSLAGSTTAGLTPLPRPALPPFLPPRPLRGPMPPFGIPPPMLGLRPALLPRDFRDRHSMSPPLIGERQHLPQRLTPPPDMRVAPAELQRPLPGPSIDSAMYGGFLPPGDMRGLPPPGDLRGFPPPGDMRGMPPPGEIRGFPPPGDMRGMPPPGDVRGFPPPGDVRGMPPPLLQPSQFDGRGQFMPPVGMPPRGTPLAMGMPPFARPDMRGDPAALRHQLLPDPRSFHPMDVRQRDFHRGPFPSGTSLPQFPGDAMSPIASAPFPDMATGVSSTSHNNSLNASQASDSGGSQGNRWSNNSSFQAPPLGAPERNNSTQYGGGQSYGGI